MKRYLVFVLFVVFTSIQGKGQTQTSTSIINNFYASGTNNTITEIIYNKKFDVELAVTYNPTDVVTNKLKMSVTLPTGDYTSTPLLQVFSSSVTISNQIYSNNILTFDITGFNTLTQTTFTVIVGNVRISPDIYCADPSVYQLSTSLSYYTGTTAINFPNGNSSKNINAKHVLGNISVYQNGNFNYSPTDDANSPLYVDLQATVPGSTHLTENLLLNFTSSQTIKTVVCNSTVVASQNIGGLIYYIIPNPGIYSINFRVYFDLAESAQSINLGLVCTAKFATSCEISGNSFLNSISVPAFTGKPDNTILNYPSIYSTLNYDPYYVYNPCVNEQNSGIFYLDNIYNASAFQSPVVVTFDLPTNVVANAITFQSGMLPNEVSVKNCSTGVYQVLQFSGNQVLIPQGTNLDNIKITFNQLPIAVIPMYLSFTYSNVIRACSSSNVTDISFSLLKNNQSHMIRTLKKIITINNNSVSLSYSKSVLSAGETITANYLQLVVMQTLDPEDYLTYTLDENMDFSNPNNLLFSFDNSNYLTLDAFNAANFSSNPMTYQIQGRTLKIQNISLKGYQSDCNRNKYILFMRVTTKVVGAPTKISNVNTISLKGKNGNLMASYPYNWSVAATQSVTNAVLFSCNDGATKTVGITIKKDDGLNVYYTLDNTTLYKYDQKTITYYCTLPTNGTQPIITLIQTNGSTKIPLILNPSLYAISYSSGNLDAYSTLVYGNTISSNSNILRVSIPLLTLDAYDKLELSLQYPASLALTSNNDVRFYANVAGLIILPQNSTLTIGPKSDCDLFNCVECITSFSPTAGEEYILSAWVKESFTDNPPTTYKNAGVRVTFNDGAINTFPLFRPTGPIVDGWQRIEASFIVPAGAKNIHIALVNESANTDVFFDDIRIHPYNSNMKSFVYNPSTQKLVAELDENNFATMYEYDDEGILIRVKKETERGVMTIKETRSNQSKIK